MSKIYCILFFIICLSPTGLTFAQKNNFAKTIKPFINISKGAYEQRVVGDEFTEREKQPQDLLFFPLWAGEQNQWFYFTWLNPNDKSRPLGGILLCVEPFDADSAKIQFYDLPEGTNAAFQWRNPIPFSDLSPEIVKNQPELAIGTGFLLLKKVDNLYWNWHTSAKLPRYTKAAPYNFVALDCRFYEKKITVNAIFSKDDKIIFEQKHNVPLLKKYKNLKKY